MWTGTTSRSPFGYTITIATNCVSEIIAGINTGQIDPRRRFTASQIPAIAVVHVRM